VQLNNTTDSFLSPLNELEYAKIWGWGPTRLIVFFKINLEQPTRFGLFF
jgi:hypothetical protein